MVCSAFVVGVENRSTVDSITVATPSRWNIAEVGAWHKIPPGQNLRFNSKKGKPFYLTIKLRDGTKVKRKIQKPCLIDMTHDRGKWTINQNPLEIESSQHQMLLREERGVHSFKRNHDFYELLGVPKYEATEQQITEAFRLLIQVNEIAADNAENWYSDSTSVWYLLLLHAARVILLDPEIRSEYDKELRSRSFFSRHFWAKKWDKFKAIFTRRFWANMCGKLTSWINRFRALPLYWKLLLPAATLVGACAAFAAMFVTCGGALPIVLSVIAGCFLTGGISSLLFATSQEASEMKSGQRDKGILMRLLLGSLLGALGGGLTAFVGPLIMSSLVNLVGPTAVNAINGAVCAWLDSALMSLVNFIPEFFENPKNRSCKKFLLVIIIFPLIGALFGAALARQVSALTRPWTK